MAGKSGLILKSFTAGINGKMILHGIDLTIMPGEIHVIMGPNGSGKTTLVQSLMGNPQYKHKRLASRRGGQNPHVEIDGVSLLDLLPEERARRGLFVSFQNPIEVTGVSFLAFLRTAAKTIRADEKKPLSVFKEEVKEALRSVSLNESFMGRSINEGSSGGERKRAEIAQMLVLKPTYAILDEIDSGLDVDSLKIIASVIKATVRKNNIGLLLITHYQRLLHLIKPKRVHILIDGKIKISGGIGLVKKIEKDGYAAV